MDLLVEKEKSLSAFRKDPTYLQSLGLISTKNNFGYTFLHFDDYIKEWLNSNRDSEKPLADLGCAYGIHTFHAIKHGRKVISVDLEPSHIKILRETADTLTEEERMRLIDSRVSRLPNKDLFEPESLAAVLSSEFVHFFKPGEPLEFFQDIYKWLIPKGLFFVSTGTVRKCGPMLKAGGKMKGGKTEKEIIQFISRASDEELISSAPMYATFPDHHDFCHMYYLSEKEIGALARAAGFEIVKITYYNSDKYRIMFCPHEEPILLVARKPA